jgi:hypothetical protein
MAELKLNAKDIRAAVVKLQEYGNTALVPKTLMLHPLAFQDLQMALDFTTPEEIKDEESLWDE